MPKETIPGAAMPIDIVIQWGAAEEHVQVASIHREPLPELPANAAGWYATFCDRRSINRMIFVLRRARDHAFGKDE